MIGTTSRYQEMFDRAAARGGHATIPYFTIGDPSPDRFLEVVDASVAAGADALELGIAFSDPSADGPANQDAMSRAREAGVNKARSFELLAEIRRRHPGLPLGLLVYANLVYIPSTEAFYAQARAAGVDSVILADVPVEYIKPFRDSAAAEGIDTVLIAPPNATIDDLRRIAKLSRGYVYLVSRLGVTGADTPAGVPVDAVISALKEAGSPPIILAFGVSKPEHVRTALEHGAAGVISGSAFSNLIARHLDNQVSLIAAIRDLVKALTLADPVTPV
ncbi:MAG: tryptophan synthase alpha chain [Actinomycetota bacterium]|jgi:tryptophan synthase alpha chain|nr:tryptophan synthase alpha chain [Actinomycetota bacterium]